MPPATTYQGLRITAASAYLKEKPNNLTIKANSQVARIIFKAKKAVGVELSDKTRCSSPKIVTKASAANRIFCFRYLYQRYCSVCWVN